MNRKIKLSLITLLGIGSISIASLPLVSCGNSETIVPPTTPGQDLKEITGITLVANPTSLTYAELQVTPITLLTTQKVFDGIDSTNYQQFDISMSSWTGQVTMDLTAKEGFVFSDNKNILTSNSFAYPASPSNPQDHSFKTANGINISAKADGTASIIESSTTYTGSTDLVIEGSYLSPTNSIRYGITSIGDNAFKDNVLTTLDLSKNTSLTSIGDNAFPNSPLTSLDLSKNTSLTSIGISAFWLSKLTTLDLSKNTSLTTIGDHAFAYSKLTTLDLSKNTLLRSISGFNLSELTTLDLTQNTLLTTIGDNAFFSSRLTTLDLFQNTLLTSIGDYAFHNSTLTSLDLSQNTLLTSIGDFAFHNSTLTSLDLSQNTSLTTIGVLAFYYSPLTVLKIPDSVTTIGNYAFNATKNIERANLKLPSQFMESSELTRIGITII